VVCGAAASGNYVWNNPEDIAKLLTCCMMSGPFLTGYTQTINDYYDREIDAINEPYRPIPSGKAVLCIHKAYPTSSSSLLRVSSKCGKVHTGTHRRKQVSTK
jgi:heme O synthase-like polyprenyltransferase